jgi:hypothetical protein
VVTTLASAFVAFAGRRVLEVRRIPVAVALGGAAGVGKTVFANVVCSRLSEGNSSWLAFTPETRTAQYVYRTISNLRRDQWPPRTGKDHIDRYRGVVSLPETGFVHRLLRGRTELELELGDMAGELWEEVGEDDVHASRLIESTFFEYVAESNALLYFIDSSFLEASPERVSDYVDDLLSALQVLRSIEGRGSSTLGKSVGLIFSKADLLSPAQNDALRRTFSLSRPSAGDAEVGARFEASLHRLEHLVAVLERQALSFEVFVVSALRSAEEMGLRRAREELVEPVESPLEWVVGNVMRPR